MTTAIATLRTRQFDTPLGTMRAVVADDGVVLLDFHDRTGFDGALARAMAAYASDAEPLACDDPLLDQVEAEIAEYFAGTRSAFTLPLARRLGTAFERAAWEYLLTIPHGETRTYGAQAKALGDAGAARAVGRANGQNFVAIAIPCHRVVGASGHLTGYGGGVDRKRWLLDHEQRGLFAAPR